MDISEGINVDKTNESPKESQTTVVFVTTGIS